MRYIAAVIIFALGAFALSLTLTKPVSAQSAPTLTAAATENGMVLNWTVSGGRDGWTLTSFDVLRTVGAGPTNVIASALAGTGRTTHTDQFGSNALNQWANGTDLTYAVRANYKRGPESQIVTFSAVIEGAAAPTQIRQGYAPTNFTSVAHADGVKLSWKFYEARMTPNGWKLAGFSIWRWIEGTQGSWTWVGQRLPATDRSIKDPLTGTSEAERLPGAKFKYEMYAIFDRLADGERQVGKNSKTSVFTAPTMPKPLNFRIGYQPGDPLSTVISRYLRLSWERPHLSWDASTGFTGVDRYHFYRGPNGYEDGNHWLTITGQYTSTTWETLIYCQGPFQLLAQYGLFYSELVNSRETRPDC